MNGKVTHASISKKNLLIEGLLIFQKPMDIRNFKILFKGKEYTTQPFLETLDAHSKHFSLNIPLHSKTPSKQILKVNKKKSSVSKIGKTFRQAFAYLLPDLFAKIYENKIRAHNPLLKITPLFQNDQEGSSFYGLANISLPIPLERENRKIGGGDLIEISSEFLNLMVEEADLKKKDHILDIGCGLGRMAYALSYYLDPQARYEGFDIMPSLVYRAQKFISPSFPNFHFRHVNVWNSFYNPQGTEKPGSFRFPYHGASFNFALLTSVFSHMLEGDIRHYLSEIYRILKPGGRCLFSCFILTPESKKLIQENKSSQKLVYPYGNRSYVASLEYPEASIGYEEDAFLDLIQEAGFKVKNICLGAWCGRTNMLNHQDIMIIEK